MNTETTPQLFDITKTLLNYHTTFVAWSDRGRKALAAVPERLTLVRDDNSILVHHSLEDVVISNLKNWGASPFDPELLNLPFGK